ncbi:MAG: hypothetical protein MUC63_05440, partial [Planctomycetes bacterium]|nr:hypothetical protein [Planctomycetota bacterium]
MKRLLPILWAALAALAPPAPAGAGEAAPPPDAPERVRELVRRLGADAWADRNAASIALERLGEAAF